MLRDYDRKVMDLINVDDFAPQDLAAQAERVSSGHESMQYSRA